MKIYEENLRAQQNLTWFVSQKKKKILTWFSQQP